MPTAKYPNEIHRDEHDETANAKRVNIVAGDLQIGAVEIKDSDSDTRAEVTAGGALHVTQIGNVTIDSQTAWDDPNAYIGLATVDTVAWSNPNTYIGLATVDLGSNNAVQNAGTNKTLIPHVVDMSDASIATIAVPTNTFNITNLVLSSSATVRMSIKSGVTYLTGNASIGITLNPGGGWVESGSPDSPVYNGLADAGAIVVEKFDMTGTKANIGGKLIYFDE